jgi:uridine phosphorylase
MLKDGYMFHIAMKAGDVGRYVLLPGDPGRCEKIAKYFDNPQLVASNREYRTYTGTLLGEKVSVTSTGIGCPSTAIAVEELAGLGADTFIRVGTAGGIQENIPPGDLAIVTAAIRDEGTTPQYLPVEFPAVANLDVVQALREGAQRLGLPHHLGITHSKDSFYGELQPQRMPVSVRLLERWKAWEQGGAICSEMESAAVFIISSILGRRAGGVMLIIDSPKIKEQLETEYKVGVDLLDIDRSIRVAVEALKILIQKDKGEEY